MFIPNYHCGHEVFHTLGPRSWPKSSDLFWDQVIKSLVCHVVSTCFNKYLDVCWCFVLVFLGGLLDLCWFFVAEQICRTYLLKCGKI